MPIPRRAWTFILIAHLLVLAGCSGRQSALDPRGPQARDLADIFWFFTAVLGLVWLCTMLGLAFALWRSRGQRDAPLAPAPRAERRACVATAVASAATVAILFVLAGVSFAVQRRIAGVAPPALTVTVTGYQWWWHVAYQESESGPGFVTANELHLPAGVPVRIRLASADVIHSLWVPNLIGKQDLIPGLDNTIQFVAEQPGLLSGQCAEFCGLQHAHMGLTVVVQPQAEFEQWAAGQRRDAEAPADDTRREGQTLFANRSCAVCHTIRGSDAAGRIGPDLTHIAGRLHLGAGVLPMTRAALASWIADPHGHKPGVHMPATRLVERDADALLDYLEGLK